MASLLSNDDCYAALSSRDERFDGQFFVAVKSTGIYCRPICRVRLPAKKNCSFFESVVQAESAGYRPCLRCRPELATRWCTERISQSLAAHAIQLLEDSFTKDNVIEAVSGKLGISDRHLRRLLREHLGVSPVQYIQTRRLLLSKQLLTDTNLLVADVASIAGFGSVRRFNALLKSAYGMTPSSLRNSRTKLKLRNYSNAGKDSNINSDDAISCELRVTQPYDFDSLFSFHARRAITDLEWVEDGVYTRSIELESHLSKTPLIGWYRVHSIDDSRLQLDVSNSLTHELPNVISIVKSQFDLDANPHHWLPSLGKKTQGFVCQVA